MLSVTVLICANLSARENWDILGSCAQNPHPPTTWGKLGHPGFLCSESPPANDLGLVINVIENPDQGAAKLRHAA